MTDEEGELSMFVLTVAKHTPDKRNFDAIMDNVVFPLLSQRDSARANLADAEEALLGRRRGREAEAKT